MLTDETTQTFIKYFRLEYANTAELIAQVHKIRYDVFCTELGLEDNCPADVEADEFDTHSYHYLLKHLPSNKYAGTIRIVLPPHDRPELITPIEKFCFEAVDPNIIDIANLPRGSFAEVSRLAVPSSFRKRAGEAGKPYIVNSENKTDSNSNGRNNFPHIAIGLYLAAASLFTLKDLKHIFVMVEPRLARSMRRIGLHFEQMGEVIEYHGQRAPFYITPELLSKHLSPEVDKLYQHIKIEVRKGLNLEHKPSSLAG